MKTTRWNREILREYLDLAMLTPEEVKIVKSRAAGWSQKRQCHELNMSPATLNRRIRKLKTEYISLQKYSDKLPRNLKF